METRLHSAAQQGFTKQADSYVRGRPEYPSALDDWLRAPLGLAPGRSVADVGAGTGKFTRLLVHSGAGVIAVEPVDAMREKLAISLPQVQALPGTAQSLPLADDAVDAVTCAQAFHWFATTDALREFHRVLRPGGVLGLVWNVRDESVDWVAELTRIVTPYEGDAPRYYKGDWRRPFEEARYFDALHETRFAYAHVGTPQAVIVDRFMSVSFIAALPAGEHAQVRAQVEELIATHPALRGQEQIAFPYTTSAFHALRLA
jgi:SAM-dependent methyltransferase